jgi:uncharacterized surface protein with fasciclin (FAS1) repeats
MSFRSSTILTASALGLLLTLGTINNASAGHGGYGYAPKHGYGAYHGYHGAYGMPGHYGHGGYSRTPMKGYIQHPVMGYPVPMTHGHGYGNPHGKGGSCGSYQKTDYFMKTGMNEAKETKAATASGDIVDVAVGAGSFGTLVAAVKAADLVDTLKGQGPFTVFAPTDEAFAKIDKADLDALLADQEKLRAVLTYHVVPGKLMAADVVKLDSAKTVQGSSISIDSSDGVKVDGANVVETDVMASNGVIHVIDSVIMPK